MSKNRGTCGIAVLKSTVKATVLYGTVEKWYRGAAVVPWYRATLIERTKKVVNMRDQSVA